MAHYVQIPKDLNDIKQKFMFGLTKRQVVSFGIGGVLGIPLFFLTRSTGIPHGFRSLSYGNSPLCGA